MGFEEGDGGGWRVFGRGKSWSGNLWIGIGLLGWGGGEE